MVYLVYQTVFITSLPLVPSKAVAVHITCMCVFGCDVLSSIIGCIDPAAVYMVYEYVLCMLYLLAWCGI